MPIMRKATSLISVLLVISITQAHEFWLQPKKYRYKVGEEVKIDFLVGENFTGEFWDMQKHRVEKLEMISAYGRKDLTSSVQPSRGNNVTYKLGNEGGHLFILQSGTSLAELDAAKFNAYLEEDGLGNIIDRRKQRNEMDQPVKENYTRLAKLLIQCGNRADEVYKRKLGLKLEIIPQADPYTLRAGDYLDCRVFFDGQPGAHQLVKVWSIIGNRIFQQNIFTENDGSIRFPISSRGPWMISTVKMVPSEIEGLDYQSFWASLVFGIEQ